MRSRVLPRIRLPFAEALFGLLIRRIVVNPSLRTSPEMITVMDRALRSVDEDRARALARLLVEHETWQCPTLVREQTNECGDDPGWPLQPELRYVAPKTLTSWQRTADRYRRLPAWSIEVLHRLYDAQVRLTGILAEEGVPLLAGSDVCGSSWEIPGSALHREFDQLHRAGLSAVQVLRATTCEAGRFLGRRSLGVVEQGAPADLVLLDGDPTADVAALHVVHAVVRAGRYHSSEELHATREQIAADRSVH